ncbi:MAG: MerR family transcriptional regulator [Deltaproteobacteria bacterium]|nr:MerR family transcriptional regulator [Deltaproteobacteria bacterium]
MPSPICSITRVAQRLKVSVRTIRTYETEGFITIERISGRCYLRPEDIEVIALVNRLRRDLGANLAGVGTILEMRQTILDLKERLVLLERETAGQRVKSRKKV